MLVPSLFKHLSLAFKALLRSLSANLGCTVDLTLPVRTPSLLHTPKHHGQCSPHEEFHVCRADPSITPWLDGYLPFSSIQILHYPSRVKSPSPIKMEGRVLNLINSVPHCSELNSSTCAPSALLHTGRNLPLAVQPSLSLSEAVGLTAGSGGNAGRSWGTSSFSTTYRM